MHPTSHPTAEASNLVAVNLQSPGSNLAVCSDQAITSRKMAGVESWSVTADDSAPEIPASTLDAEVLHNEYVEVLWNESGAFGGHVRTPWTQIESWTLTATTTSIVSVPLPILTDVQPMVDGNIGLQVDADVSAQDMPIEETLTEHMGITWSDGSRVFAGHVRTAWPLDDSSAVVHLGDGLDH